MSISSMTTASELRLSRTTAIWLAASGILGSIIMYTADMLFYYNGDQTDFIVNMGSAAPEKIIANGVCALVACWLYTLAAGQIFYAFQPTKKWIQLTVFFSFAAIMIGYGVGHATYISIAISAQNAVGLNMPADSLISLAVETKNALSSVTFIPFGIFTVLFVPLVLLKKTHFPRWIILFSPIVLFLLKDLIIGNLDGKWQVIIGGGYLNLILMVFFSASMVAFWLSSPDNNQLQG